MKLSGRDSARFCKAPDARLSAALLFGPDAATVSAARREIVAALSEGDEMRVTRLEGAAIRKDPAALDEAVRARGFFPGRRVVLIETARDEIAETLKAVLADISGEDAFIVAEAGALAPRSSLRKLFEGSRVAAACGLYPDPPDPAELAADLKAAGLAAGLTREAEGALAAAVHELDRAQLTQLVEKIALYGASESQPLDAQAVLGLMPAATEAELDRLIDAVAAGRADEVVPLLSRVAAGGGSPVQVLIAAGRMFRQLVTLASAPDGIEAAIARLRPPVFGPRRTALSRQAAAWSSGRAEAALRLLQETDLTLRSPGARPDRAMVERCLIRIAMMGARG
ncbi:DNA polymerase III subunit delta [Limibaculum sp. M0105]|uniref:DNA-directed DNA polymerase n=1 Tax=Thermohalobaculum xanthum TaxID=2753746 RepID=A0A8J7M8H5_9RHOB|nr:DNA polymerase III subunit delta [Thermohalobaculum xanthum]MBK0400534.1 DNA polymerase III subunit delta [Thermohalobaculum xanthum]